MEILKAISDVVSEILPFELKKEQNDPLTHALKGKSTLGILPNSVTPARAFVKCTKGHSGYWVCDKSCQKGVYTERRATFSCVHANRRTDQTFENSDKNTILTLFACFILV